MEKKIFCHIETVTAIIRAGPEMDEYGKPYEFACTAIMDGEKAILKGACGKFSGKAMRSILKALKEFGITRVYWDKLNNKKRSHEHDTDQ